MRYDALVYDPWEDGDQHIDRDAIRAQLRKLNDAELIREGAPRASWPRRTMAGRRGSVRRGSGGMHRRVAPPASPASLNSAARVVLKTEQDSIFQSALNFLWSSMLEPAYRLWRVGADCYAVTPGRDAAPVLGIVSRNAGERWKIEHAGKVSSARYESVEDAVRALIDLVKAQQD